MTPQTILILAGAIVVMFALGAAWARWQRAWRDYRQAVATTKANWKTAWWHTWSLTRIAGITALAIAIAVIMLRG
jgi:hypothetical protein